MASTPSDRCACHSLNGGALMEGRMIAGYVIVALLATVSLGAAVMAITTSGVDSDDEQWQS